MKCPFRIHSIERDNFMDGAKQHNEEFEECYKNDCPFYAKKEKREFCMRANLEVITNHVENYTI